jgi:hypothetical protein
MSGDVVIVIIIVIVTAISFLALSKDRIRIRSRAERRAIRTGQEPPSNGKGRKRRNKRLFRKGRTRGPRPGPPSGNGHKPLGGGK